MKKYLPAGPLCLFLALVFSSCNKGRVNYTIGIRENIHHDDFEYSVRSLLAAGSLNQHEMTASPGDSIYYLVRFRVQNRALRVAHKWDNSIAYIKDEPGNRYENDLFGQVTLEKTLHFGWKEDYSTQAGSSDSTILVFRLPGNVRKPCLMVRGETLMGDVLNRCRFRKMRVRLY